MKKSGKRNSMIRKNVEEKYKNEEDKDVFMFSNGYGIIVA